ncbi:MAG: repressor LexA [Ignavibacteriae bacterium]|nr:repressor LexA [Ignavibacteriota bacterium]
MSKELTTTQHKILDYLIEMKSKGLMPTLAEIANHFSYKNRSTVQQHLSAIEKKGFIKRNPKLARGIEITIEDRIFVTKPVLGEVAAGNPLIIYPDAIDSIELPTIANMPQDSFLLKVKGESLKDAYIFNGDFVIINPTLEPKDGQFVAAVLDDAAVVKKMFKKKDQIELHSENPEYKPIIIRSNYDKFKIVGVVIGVYRKMQNKVI